MALDLLTIPPESGQATFAIIGLHGRNASAEAFLPFVRQMRFDDARWVLPSAPYAGSDEHTIRWWFEHEQQNVAEIASSRVQLAAVIDAQTADGIAPENILLVGFSQGAVMAVETALRYPRRLGGVVALSGYVAHPDLLAHEAHPANRSVPIFLAHGLHDEVLTIEVGRANHAVLTRLGYPVDYREYDTAHRIASQETRDIRAFLHRHMYGMDPSDPRIGQTMAPF